MFGAIEAGGTKFVCAVGTNPGDLETATFVTHQDRDRTLREVLNFFKGRSLQAVGIGSFGPLDLHPGSPSYGRITTTPKRGWADTPLVPLMSQVTDAPIAFDTDVNAAALGEATYGEGLGLKNLVYVTIGTGVGVGAIVDGRLLHGVLHPEAGHLWVKRIPGDPFEGACPFHGDCWEGLVSGPALKQRYGRAAQEVGDDERDWHYTADYIAQAAMNLTLTLSPQRIVFGGGVAKRHQLMKMVKERFTGHLNGYLKLKEVEEVERFLVSPGCGDRSGILGALELARRIV
jgi:fructokinase